MTIARIASDPGAWFLPISVKRGSEFLNGGEACPGFQRQEAAGPKPMT